MLPAVKTVSDVEVIEALDFEPEVVCDALAKPPSCVKPADWYLTCRACGHTVPFCDCHVEYVRRRTIEVGTVYCTKCRARATSIDELVSMTRVRGRA